MNDARRRREVIREKARKMRNRHWRARMNEIIREEQEELIRKSALPETRLALVYLKTDLAEEDYITAIDVDLPIENPTEKLRDMQKNGFWVASSNGGDLLYFPPDSILKVRWRVFPTKCPDCGEMH